MIFFQFTLLTAEPIQKDVYVDFDLWLTWYLFEDFFQDEPLPNGFW